MRTKQRSPVVLKELSALYIILKNEIHKLQHANHYLHKDIQTSPYIKKIVKMHPSDHS